MNNQQAQNQDNNDQDNQKQQIKKDQNSQKEPIAMQPIIVLWKILQMNRSKNLDPIHTIQHQERMLYFTLDLLGDKVPAQSELPFNFTDEFVNFQKAVNENAMNLFHSNKEQESINLLVKAIDMFLYQKIAKYVRPIEKFGEMKVLSFNNLACIYQNRKQFIYALKAIQFAVEIEEQLVNDNYGNSKKNIISTYINLGVIQSQLGKHDKSIGSINKAIDKIKELEKQFNQESQKKEESKDKVQQDDNLQKEMNLLKGQKLISNYNIAVENEHLQNKKEAIIYYQQAKDLALELKENDLNKKIDIALKQLKQ